MKTSKVFITALAAMAIAACSNDNELTEQPSVNPDVNAPDVYASFSINIPHALMSRAVSATSTDHGTSAENTVNSLYVFIYDADSPHTPTVAEFSVAKGTLTQKPAGGTTWVTDKPIKTKKTDKYIFAGVNLNADIVNNITTNGFGAFSYKEFAQDISNLADQTNGFVMFNDAYPVITPATNLYEKESDAQSNHITIPVSRVVAKAAVFKATDFEVNGGGNMTDIKFGWRNLNKKLYFIQDTREELIKDYNWQSFSTQDFNRGTDALNIYLPTDNPTLFTYATENAFEYISGVSKVNGATFISVSGVFTPDKVISTSKPAPTATADFETIDNPNSAGSTFYVVRTTDGIANYFADGAIAEKYAALCIANTPGMPSFQGTYVLDENTYSNGLCYYHIFVNSNAATPQAPYNVYRNQYFKVNVHSIQAPGNPSDNFDNGEVIKPETWIGVDIEVNPWEVIEEDYDL